MLSPVGDIRGSNLFGGSDMLGPVNGQGLVDGGLTPSSSPLNSALGAGGLGAPSMLDPVSGFDGVADDLASFTCGLDIFTDSGGKDLFSPGPADLGTLSAGMSMMAGESGVDGIIASLQGALRDIAGGVRGIGLSVFRLDMVMETVNLACM